MADFHFSVSQVKRSTGQSAVACAAYRAGEKLYSEYYGETSDYTHKEGVIENGIILPSFVSEEYKNREFLWNSVEKNEKHPKAQLAYSFDFSLQNEFSMEENIAVARQFIKENFADRGMICDYAIHLPDTSDGGVPNPHVHLMCPIRPMDENGHWGEKQKRVYKLDEHGNRIRDGDGNELYNAVPTTDWGLPETLEAWRTAWAEINNRHFAEKGLDVRIDNRSYEKQGLDLIPTVHEGANVREMEKKGILTEKGDRNRWIRQINGMIKNISRKLKSLAVWIDEIREARSKPKEPSLIDLLVAYNNKQNENAWSFVAKNKNLKKFTELFNYLTRHNITTVEQFEARIREVGQEAKPVQEQIKAVSAKISKLESIEKAGAKYMSAKPVYEKYCSIFFKKAKEKYAAEHDKELKSFYANRRKAEPYIRKDGQFDVDRLHREREALFEKIENIRDEHAPFENEIAILNKIRWQIKQVSASDIPYAEHITPPQKQPTQPKKEKKKDEQSL